MSGLLKQALHIRSNRPPEQAEDDDALGVSEEERREIAEQITAALRREGPGLEEANYAPKRRGIMLPLLVNAFALLFIVLTILTVPRIMQPNEVALAESGAELRGAEGLVIGSVREAAEAELQEKQQEISLIESRLAAANEERAGLAEQFEEAIASREVALRKELESELSTARARLEAQGAGAEQIEAEIQALETRRQEALLAELQAERQAAQEELARRESELQAELSQAQAEQAALEAELQQELESERAGMEAQLATLQARDREEQALLAQVNGFYQEIASDIRTGEHAAALSRLESLTQFLGRASFDRFPRLAQRREADNFTTEAFTLLLEERLAWEATTASTTGAAPDRDETELAAMQEQLAALREELRTAEDEITGRESQLATLEAELESAQAAGASEVATLEIRLEVTQAELTAALEELDTNTLALQERRSEVEALRENLSQTRSSLAELRERRAAVTQAISTIRSRAGEASPQSTESDRAEVISMLTTKLQVKQLLSSEAMRAAYPDLYDRMDSYLAALETQSEAEGRTAALEDLSQMTANLRRPNPASDTFDALWATYATEAQRENLLQFLDNLRALTEG